MARKKSRDKAGGGSAGPFRSDPFKQLKGFAVSAPPDAKTEKPKRPDPAPAGEEEADIFAREMGRLGVSPKGEEEAVAPEERTSAEDRIAPPPPSSDSELFLDALKGMDTVFEDAFPADEEEVQASPRAMKLLRQGRLAPEAKLDLHGLTREEARTKVRHFLDDSLYQGRRTVLIVTGRGKGSGGEPVLRAEVERYLAAEAGAWVSEWGRAPGRYGGEGALVVFLKKGSMGS